MVPPNVNRYHFLHLEDNLEMHSYGLIPVLIETNDRSLVAVEFLQHASLLQEYIRDFSCLVSNIKFIYFLSHQYIIQTTDNVMPHTK